MESRQLERGFVAPASTRLVALTTPDLCGGGSNPHSER
jgi:hypothetical protein